MQLDKVKKKVTYQLYDSVLMAFKVYSFAKIYDASDKTALDLANKRFARTMGKASFASKEELFEAVNEVILTIKEKK